jgi:hypothetical protein
MTERMRALRFFSVAALALSVLPAGAHPGHGLFEYGAMHQLTSPFHVAMAAAAALVFFSLGLFVRQPVRRKQLRTLCRVFLLLALTLVGLRVPAW